MPQAKAQPSLPDHPGPVPEPEDPNRIPDGRDLRPESVFPPPATWGCHLPPGNGFTTRAARGAAPTWMQLCRDAVPTLPAKAMPSRGACWHGDMGARGCASPLDNWPTDQLFNLFAPCPRVTLPTCPLSRAHALERLQRAISSFGESDQRHRIILAEFDAGFGEDVHGGFPRLMNPFGG